MELDTLDREHPPAAYVVHYNEHRPHRALAQRSPLNELLPSDKQSIGDVIALTHVPRRDLLGELIHEYRLVA